MVGWCLDAVRGASLGAKVGGRGSLAAGYSAHKKAQSRPGFGLLRASVLTSNREEKQLVLQTRLALAGRSGGERLELE